MRSGHILIVGDVAVFFWSFLTEKLLAFGKGQTDFLSGFWDKKFLAGVDGSDKFDFLGTAL